MDIPKIRYEIFIDDLSRSHINFILKSRPNLLNNENSKSRMIARHEFEEVKDLIHNLIVENFPAISKESEFNLALLTRIAIYLNLDLNINASKFLNKYNLWRGAEGKGIFVFYSDKLKKRISVDQFILKGKKNIEEFDYEWVGLKPALSKNTPLNKDRIKSDSGVGQKNYLKLKKAVNSAALKNKIPGLYYQTFIKDDKTTLHEFNGSRDDLYFLMTKITKLDMKQSIFKKIITDFVKVYYRKNMPKKDS